MYLRIRNKISVIGKNIKIEAIKAKPNKYGLRSYVAISIKAEVTNPIAIAIIDGLNFDNMIFFKVATTIQ
ncbi:hypothetical protein A2164_01260 [Candidatus Curtissbacteria bacterium RBG_13_35_7]|uniref:Uncharacterized protein n=1 Tax=Candidatus Curtissbacteria bacterium RBG_13_35_7 TaxID=1797705 RepID=A0A1F5G3A9_9BACT|nr:MAG: hypothetical protein A2164_01260 [Candidatus Curtissbacteria bacterium RBG_13_35_7]